MGDRIMKLYHAMPAPLRSAAATLRGARLRWWRYGGDSEEIVAEALDREHWSVTRLHEWQEERLAQMLERAATRVPYYRAQWEARRRQGDRASWQYLENWPLLSKETLRREPGGFVADDRSPGRLFQVHTSGTTGKSLTLWRSRRASREYYAVLEARYRRWHGVSWRDRWAILGGQTVVPSGQRKPPFWVWNAAMHQLYLSANHVSAQNAAAYVGAMKRYGVNHLVAYPASAAELARRCLEAGVSYDGLRVVVANAEPVTPEQRDVIRRAFGVPTRETYGMVEIVAGASECPSGSMHAWPELGHVEIIRDESEDACAPGLTGRMVCTGLVNEAMPLVRYVMGDRGSLPAAPEPCTCGRTLPLSGKIEGRSNDMLLAPDGRRVYWLNPVFYGLPVDEAQIVQEEIDRVRIRYAAGAGFSAETAETIRQRLRGRMGDVKIVLEPVQQVPRGANGKFRAVVCQVPESQRQAVASR